MYLCIYVSMYLCIYVSMYLCIYVSMYIVLLYDSCYPVSISTTTILLQIHTQIHEHSHPHIWVLLEIGAPRTIAIASLSLSNVTSLDNVLIKKISGNRRLDTMLDH